MKYVLTNKENVTCNMSSKEWLTMLINLGNIHEEKLNSWEEKTDHNGNSFGSRESWLLDQRNGLYPHEAFYLKFPKHGISKGFVKVLEE